MRTASSRSWALLVNVLAASPLVTAKCRARLYRRAGMTVGDDTLLRPHCWVFGEQLSVGKGTYIGYACHLENQRPIVIGARCSISYQVSIATSTHLVGNHERRAGIYDGRPVEIADGCWIGTRAVILPGVRIGAGCIIAAGAVVTRDCEADGTYAGVPARRVAELAREPASSHEDLLQAPRARPTGDYTGAL